jgi:hypothetical protein
MKIILLQTAKCTWLCAVICLTMLACQSMSHPESFAENLPNLRRMDDRSCIWKKWWQAHGRELWHYPE